MRTSYDAVVLAGGAAKRLGGADKPALPVGGLALLDRVLAACEGARETVVVGPRRPTARPVRWTREEPAGGGPLPALAAGLAALAEGADGTNGTNSTNSTNGDQGREGDGGGVVLVLAADLPFLTAAAVAALVGALGTPEETTTTSVTTAPWEGVMLTDSGGRDQPLAAAYRPEPLRRELALLGAEHGQLAALPLRLLTGELTLRRIADPTGDATFDCDTWEDVAAARARLDPGAEA